MKPFRFAAALTLTLILLTSAASYGGGGEGSDVPITECNDGIDNDGDGEIDGNDSGCTKPYYKDDTEGNFYDLDASWVFSDQSKPTNQGPSAFFGSAVIDPGLPYSPLNDQVTANNVINETYVANATEFYGSGNISWTSISLGTANDGQTTDKITGKGELIDDPGIYDCGNSMVDGGENTLSCPEDAGLPDDEGQSSKTVSDTLSDWGAGTIPSSFGDGTDPVRYEMDMVIEEFNTEGESCVSSNSRCVDISGSRTGDYRYGFDSWYNTPDFYLGSGSRIRAVHGTVASDEWVKIGEVTDYDTEREEVDHVSGGGTMMGGTCSGSNCVNGDPINLADDECKSTSTGSVDDYSGKLRDDTKVLTPSQLPQRMETSESGSSSYSRDTTSKPLNLQVEHDDIASADYESYTDGTSCGGQISGSQNQECTDRLQGVDCTVSGGVRIYSEGSKTYRSSSKDTISFYYRNADYEESNVFDINPAENPSSTAPERALFEGDSFKGGSWNPSDTESLSLSGTGYFSWEVSPGSRDQSNDPAVSVSSFSLDVDSSNDFQSVRDGYSTYDVDGPGGHGDGYIAISEGSAIGKTVGTVNNETTNSASGSFSTMDFVNLEAVENNNDLSCPGDKTSCVASLDISLKNLGSWGSTNVPTATQVNYELDKRRLNASYGVCRLYRSMTADSVSCDPDTYGDPDDETGAVCGDEPNEWTAFMEGPEVNDSTLNDNEIDQEGCISKKTQCILHGEAVNEGTVADVASNATPNYEAGGDSPDFEVCLEIPYKGDTNDGDNIHDLDGDGDRKDTDGDNQYEEFDTDDDNDSDVGGEWYDLDNETVNQYIESSGSHLINYSTNFDSNGDGTYNERDIDFYLVENPNPYHPNYTEGGGNTSIALEDDCGPGLDGCDDAGDTVNGKNPLFYSTFQEGDRDDDYNPFFIENELEDQEPYYEGYVNKIEDDSNQLEDSMDTSLINPDNPSWKTAGLYERSISNTSIDQYALTANLSTAISTRGGVYNPGNVYLRSGVSPRTSSDDASDSKSQRVFGNSFVDLATHSDSGKGIEPGDGVWIDPDYVKKSWENGEYRNTSFFNSWRGKLSYRMDLTGPDAGLGFDTGGGSSYNHLTTGSTDTDIVIGDIYFEGEADGVDNDGNAGADEAPASESYEGTDIVGETTPRLEPPMCGDDRKEFLIEEMGESVNSVRYDGGYACADSVNTCVDMSAEQRVVDSGTYRNADEPLEESGGRATNDMEVCGQTSIRSTTDQKYRWLDQDLRSQYCRENSFYGDQAVRWFSSDYVTQHPGAVENGIDDDWNPYMDQEGKSTAFSVVDNGNTSHSKVRTRGFCGGDDAGEFYVTQRCSSSLCETDTDVRGMVSTPGACILDESKYSAVSGNDRDTYQPGETVTFDYGDETRKMRCLEGRWHDKWPIVAEVDSTDIVLGDTGIVSFYVVNPTSGSKTFDLQIESSDMQRFSQFETTGTNSRTVTVDARSSQRVDVEAVGGRESIDSSPVTVQATDSYSDLTGQASTQVDVIPQPSTGSAEDPNDVPGIGAVQLAVVALTALSALFIS